MGRAIALGVGGLVMLIWRILGPQGDVKSVGDSGGKLGLCRFQVEGWLFTLVSSKVTKFLSRRFMIAAVRFSRGIAWVPLKAVAFAFCGAVTGLLVLFVDSR